MFASALTGAVCSVLYRPYLRRYPVLQVSAVAMLASVAFLAIPAAWEGFFAAAPAFTPGGWAAIVFIGVSSGLGYYCWLWALRHTDASRVAVFLALSPITATLLGALLLDEVVSLIFLLRPRLCRPGNLAGTPRAARLNTTPRPHVTGVGLDQTSPLAAGDFLAGRLGAARFFGFSAASSASSAVTRASSSSCSSRARTATALIASNSSRGTRSMPCRTRSNCSRSRASDFAAQATGHSRGAARHPRHVF